MDRAFDAFALGLMIEYRNACDLSTPYWCTRATRSGPAWFFKGTNHDTCSILADIAAALAYLLEQGIVHNDIKPGNVLYSPSSGAVLIDFGLARLTATDHKELGGGTPWYVAPEFLAGDTRKPLADVFSLGVMALYLLHLIRLPEREKGWDINAIHEVGHSQRTKEARRAMESWMQNIQRHREALQSPGVDAKEREARLLVGHMLEQNQSKRIRARDLATQTREWRTQLPVRQLTPDGSY